jgi:hypothetical protein
MLSLRIRIFLSMIVLIIMASVILASISISNLKWGQRIPQERLERNENAVKQHINFILSTTTYPLTSGNLDLIFKDKIHNYYIHST